MNFFKPLRKLYIKSTDFTHSYQGKDKKLVSFYKAWSYCYDFSVNLDPAFGREMKTMIGLTVKPGDTTLDIGCGTGISTFYASRIVAKVIGIDLSADMVRKLEQKISRRKSVNIEVITGRFPEALPHNIRFNSIISSFAIVHFTPEQRKNIYKQIYNLLLSGGRLGLFSAQGEIASSFETKNEIVNNLESAGFNKIEVDSVSDIYRIIKAEKQ
ncbi:MAG: methyltransferase domain-containing protein [Deltaproteobacteria bacterium]|nr:methyltransferase domain-containing protein [Deltaproteobacteria bacterium]